MNSNSRFWTLSPIVLMVSAATQFLTIGYYWWHFEPRLSCDRLLYWGEWLDCLHGPSHIHVTMFEFAMGCWLIGGLAALLGRYLPAYVSVLLPLILAIVMTWFMIDQVRDHIYIYGELTASNFLLSIVSTAILLVFVAGPSTGGWLAGMRRRKWLRATRLSSAAAA